MLQDYIACTKAENILGAFQRETFIIGKHTLSAILSVGSCSHDRVLQAKGKALLSNLAKKARVHRWKVAPPPIIYIKDRANVALVIPTLHWLELYVKLFFFPFPHLA